MVNEAYADDGSGKPRTSNLQDTGGDWIEAAFRAARPPTRRPSSATTTTAPTRSTPRAPASTRWSRTLRLAASRSTASGSSPTWHRVPSTYEANLQRFADLGVDVQITELDIAQGSTQASTYASVVKSCLAVSRCTGITTWGVRDSDSCVATRTRCCSTATVPRRTPTPRF